MGYRISDLARRSGFSASTLRYYETVGLVPAPDRTVAGHRVYDERALERLEFIARAKTMGLALDDIVELVGLWADGPCAPVHDRLRHLLGAKVGEVRDQLAELSRFAAQLEHIRDSLAASEPAERCGPGCGCDTGLPAPLSPEPAWGPVPIACTLSPAEAVDRATVWADLLAQVTDRQATVDGVRLRLPAGPDAAAHAAELAVREAECCAFFSFAVTVDSTGAWLDVAAPPEGRTVLDALFGTVDG
jgi:DNA-binding transcriptional MerR regulator